jgi:hypothetical protein
MTEHVHPGPHLDPELLNAFVEGVLPEHERQQCLSHVAECSRCREIVFLAQPPQPAPEPVPSKAEPWWRRWFGPIPVLGSALAACAFILAVLFQHGAPKLSHGDAVTYQEATRSASASPATVVGPVEDAPPASEKKMRASAPQAPPASKPAGDVLLQKAAETPSASSPVIDIANTVEPNHLQTPVQLPAVQSPAPATGIAQKQLLAPSQPEATFAAKRQVQKRAAVFAASPAAEGSPSDSLKLSVEHNQITLNGLSEVKGSVTDTTGAAIVGATVTIHPLAGSAGSTAKTGEEGQFAINALAAGQYELQIESPGFQKASTQLELQPQDLATVESKLSIGSVTESVEVTALNSALLSTGRPPPLPLREAHPLPSKLPIASSAISAMGIIAVDSAGTLFFRQDVGKQWTVVNPQWPGKVARVAVSAGSMVGRQLGQGKSSAALPSASAVRPPVFHLFTDKGSAWFSQDGTHWYPELPSP